MDHILGYYVFDPRRGWLSFDEKTWTPHFEAANEFTDAKLANDVGERESALPEDIFYVFACLGSP